MHFITKKKNFSPRLIAFPRSVSTAPRCIFVRGILWLLFEELKLGNFQSRRLRVGRKRSFSGARVMRTRAHTSHRTHARKYFSTIMAESGRKIKTHFSGAAIVILENNNDSLAEIPRLGINRYFP